MIGQRFTDKASGLVWEVVGQHASQYVIAPIDHSDTPEYVTAAVLAARFRLKKAPEPVEPDPQDGWQALADEFRNQTISRARNGNRPTALTPEQQLAAAAEADDD